MGEDIKPAIIKKTQDTLGKFIKRPPLTEKLLRKPPFRFLHDVVTSVIRDTNFLDGLFSEEEMKSENVCDKESKMAFLQKVIDVVNIACGVTLSVRPAKIVAGYEPEKTNELLQIIGRAIEKKVDSSAAVQRVLSKGSLESDQPREKKPQPKKEEHAKRSGQRPAAPEKKQPVRRGEDVSKQQQQQQQRRISTRGSDATKVVGGGRGVKKGEGSGRQVVVEEEEGGGKQPPPSQKRRKRESEGKAASGDAKKQHDMPKAKTIAASPRGEKKAVGGIDVVVARASGRVERGGRRGSSAVSEANPKEAAVIGEEIVVGGEEEEAKAPVADEAPPEVVVDDSSSSGRAPPLPDGTRPERGEDASGEEMAAAPVVKKRQPMSAATPREEPSAAVTASSSQRMAISTPVVRPSSAMASRVVSRPRSSRPHAPRLRSALGGLIAAEGESQRGGGGGGAEARGGQEEVITHEASQEVGTAVAGDSDANASEFVVEEAPLVAAVTTVAQAGGAEEQPQRGLLVAKILETQRELEAGGGDSKTSNNMGQEEREAGWRLGSNRGGASDVEALRCSVQAVARSAHPLGALLTLLHENVDAMRAETVKWRSQSEQLHKRLKDEDKQMELELQPLHAVLSEVEQRVRSEREAVSAAKVRVFRADERIRSMLHATALLPVPRAS